MIYELIMSVITGQHAVSTMSNCMVVLPELIIDIMRRPHVHIRNHAVIMPAYLDMATAGRREPASSIIISTGQCLLDVAQPAQHVMYKSPHYTISIAIRPLSTLSVNSGKQCPSI
jgi:hypothetical protein